MLLGVLDIGEEGVPVWISGPPSSRGVEATPSSIIDVVPGRGGMFSLDNGRERRFLTRSRVVAER